MKSGVGSIWWVIVGALVIGCSSESVVDEASTDAGADADACPEYKPDGGVIQLRRGCPLTIDYTIK